MDSIWIYYILKYLHLIGIIFVVGNTFSIIRLNHLSKNMEMKFSTYYNLIRKFNHLLSIGLIVAIISGLCLLFFITIQHPVFDIKMTFLVINLGIIGYASHGTLAKYKRNISTGNNSSEDFEKLDSRFVNGFIISAILWLLIIALAILI